MSMGKVLIRDLRTAWALRLYISDQGRGCGAPLDHSARQDPLHELGVELACEWLSQPMDPIPAVQLALLGN